MNEETINDPPKMVFEALNEAIASFPEELRDALMVKFTSYYTNPATECVEEVVQKRMTDERAQQLLFQPSSQDGRWYVLLIQCPPKGAPDDHPCMITCHRYLAMLYLYHARNWDFSKEFILHGGLAMLAEFFTHDNIHLRGQALDTFTQLTSNSSFDWFDTPQSFEDKALHNNMLKLVNTSNLIHKLVENKDTPAFSFCALQILAFYMSWMRKLYTKGELRLSSALLATLSEWQLSSEQDEAELATKVFEDFNRWPAADNSDISGVEYPSEIQNLYQASAALNQKDYGRVIELCNDTVESNNCEALPPAEKQRAYLLRASGFLERRRDNSDLKNGVADMNQALEMDVMQTSTEDRLPWIFAMTQALKELELFDRAIDVLEKYSKAYQDSKLESLQEELKLIQTLKATALKKTGSQVKKENDLIQALLQRSKAPSTMQISPEIPKDEPKRMVKVVAKVNPASKVSIQRVMPQTKAVMKTSAFTTNIGRKLLKAKNSPSTMAELLEGVHLDDFTQAATSVLTEDVLIGILRGLEKCSNRNKAMEIFKCLIALPKYQFTLDLASPEVHELVACVDNVFN
ncbi:hypothetical protein THRCLA_08527 [Thraustotheca clavata]|uniref:Uncharacterized protein n=1 Tax=Thraustotheca clavata TaxID=74557 RepID=A0A1V9Z575_9STRA|nr:hypothetical protein THRCLA_08527 [Thraustotheca clavata]